MGSSRLRINVCKLPTCDFPQEIKLNCSPQELKEGLAHGISSHCQSSAKLKQFHARAICSGLRRNLHICRLLMNKYFSFQDVGNARRVFDYQKPRHTKTLFWNTFFRGCLRNGQAKSVLEAYSDMKVCCSPESMPDSHTFNLVITACTDLSEFELGFQVHSCIWSRGLESDLLVATALISLYCKAGELQTAYELFEGMPHRDAVTWNAMISGFSRIGSLCKAITMFERMRICNGISPTEATLVSLVSICGDLCSLDTGEVLHSYITKIGSGASQSLLNSLMKMYIECGCLDLSSRLFNGLLLKDAVSWSTMIGGYVRHGCSNGAIKLFRQMVSSTPVQPTRPVLLNVLLACAELGDWRRGQLIQEDYLRTGENRLESDACLSTALLYMYAKCGRMDISLKLLSEVAVVRNEVIAWNTLFKACAEVGEVHRASELMLKMQRSNINPDAVTILTLLTIFSCTPLLCKGMEVHAHVIKRGFELERPVANSLIEMYAKCGHIKDSDDVFYGIQEKDVVSWSSIIKAYAWNGNTEEVLRLFQLMRETETKPNHITFVAILSACSHAGYVEKGRDLFKCMKEEYALEPSLEHYACMVDLFCRAGHLSEAYGFLKEGMRVACTSAVLWGTLLSACRVQSNWLIGEAVVRKLLYLEPRNAANYRMLAEIYISTGHREEASGVLQLLRVKGLQKVPGFSWFEGG